VKANFRRFGLTPALVDRLLEDGWTQGTLLPDITTQNLKDAGLKAGHIAAVKRMYSDQHIPNPDLNPQSAHHSPLASPPVSAPEPEKQAHLASDMKVSSTRLSTPAGRPTVYKLQMRKTGEDPRKKIRSFEIGPSTFSDMKPEKHILVVGATGSGKTTWINGIANFVYSVQWADSFRFKVVTEEDETGAVSVNRQAHAQTDFATSYKFLWQPGFPRDFHLVVVDTPGFGDTRGIQRDEETKEQLKALFSSKGRLGVDQLDAIAFVVQASNARLTATQKYIFRTVLSIFGRDAIENLLIIATFADDGDPQVMHAINEESITYQRLLKFNNSALFGPNPPGTDTPSSLYWEIGVTGYQDLFTALQRLEPRSLTLTCEVMQERNRLCASIDGLQRLIRKCISELDVIAQERRIMEQHKLDIQANSNFTVEMNVTTEQQVHCPPEHFVTNCVICNMTCHLKCAYSDNADKIHCSAMNSDGHCRICPKKCMWHQHQHQPFYWESVSETRTVTSEELKAKYTNAQTGFASAAKMLAAAEKRYNSIKSQLAGLVEEARRCVEHLGQIAARPNPLSSTDYIDLLIEAEKSEAKEGWQIRVKYLQGVRANAEIEERLHVRAAFNPDDWTNRSTQPAAAEKSATPTADRRNQTSCCLKSARHRTPSASRGPPRPHQ
jgi:hypothetical protein